jgi:hypothetical protein
MSVTITTRQYKVTVNQRVVRPAITRQSIRVVTIAKQGPRGVDGQPGGLAPGEIIDGGNF